MGRPRSEMTDERIEAILRTVRLGLHPDRAAMAHGVSPATLRQHKRRNPEFVTALKEAEASAEQGFLGRILKHTDKQWTAAAWMLERRWPERWAKREAPITSNEARDMVNRLRAAAQFVNDTIPKEPK